MISHNHFIHVAFVSILVSQTFDRAIFGTLSFPGTRWYMVTVRDPEWYAIRKSLGTTVSDRCLNHCVKPLLRSILLFQSFLIFAAARMNYLHYRIWALTLALITL